MTTTSKRSVVVGLTSSARGYGYPGGPSRARPARGCPGQHQVSSLAKARLRTVERNSGLGWRTDGQDRAISTWTVPATRMARPQSRANTISMRVLTGPTLGDHFPSAQMLPTNELKGGARQVKPADPTMNWVRRLLAMTLAAALLGAACSSSDDSVQPTAQDDETTVEQGDDESADDGGATNEEAGSADTGSAAPVVAQLEFTAPTVDGGELIGTDYAGTDTVFWFWAPW